MSYPKKNAALSLQRGVPSENWLVFQFYALFRYCLGEIMREVLVGTGSTITLRKNV